MLTLPLGILGFLCVVLFSLQNSDPVIFLNIHSLVIVCVGSLMILAIANPARMLRSFYSVIQSLFQRAVSDEEINAVLLELSKTKALKSSTSHSLIQYSVGVWEQGLDPETTVLLMKQKLDQINQETAQAVLLLRNLAKYPPALGMTGTVIGLISLFSSLTPESKNQIGPSLAMAMTATFYGLILSNAVLMPIADRLQVMHQNSQKRNRFIFQILCLIHEGQPNLVIREEVYAKSA